jgi:hypothetical protein
MGNTDAKYIRNDNIKTSSKKQSDRVYAGSGYIPAGFLGKE